MKDALNMTYGFGCHCRNCEHRTDYDIGNGEKIWRCAADILRPEHMNMKSFCSVGTPIDKEMKGRG